MAPKKPQSADILNETRTVAMVASLPGAETETVRRRAIEQVQSVIECRRIVDQILVDVDDEIVRMHIDHMTIPWTVQSMLTDIMESIHIAFSEREEPLDEDSWCDLDFADVVETLQEPSEIPPDPWCRGIMNKRRPIQLPALLSGSTASAVATIGNSPALARSKEGKDHKKAPAPPVTQSNDKSLDALPLKEDSLVGNASFASGGPRPSGPSRKDANKPINPVLNSSIDLVELGIERPPSAAAGKKHHAPKLNISKASTDSRPQSKESGRSSIPGGGDTTNRSSLNETPGSASLQIGSHHGGKASALGHRSGSLHHSTLEGKGSSANQPANGNTTPHGGRFTDEEMQIFRQQKEMQSKMNQLRRIAEKMEHQLNEVKGGNGFIVDGSTHSVIPVHNVDPQSLPPRQEPKVVVEKNESSTKKGEARNLATPDVSAINKSSGDGRPQSKQQGRGGTPIAISAAQQQQQRQRIDYSLFYTQEAQTQPMIVEVAPAAGVVAKDGDVVRRSELRLPKSKMTKSDFAKLVQQQNAPPKVDDGKVSGLPTSPTDLERPSPPLSSVRKSASVAAMRKSNPTSTSETAATPPPRTDDFTQRNETSILDQPPQRALTPQPTATRPATIKHQSPTREHTKRPNSSAMHAAARSHASELLSTVSGNAARAVKAARLVVAEGHDDETAREFLDSLEMGDFDHIEAPIDA